jgi:putative ABC transport system permease protein
LPRDTLPTPASRTAATMALTDAIRGLPGVGRIVLTNGQPPNDGTLSWGDDWLADDPHSTPVTLMVHSFGVGPEFFAFYGIPIVRGRTFLPSDGSGEVIVGARLAAALWPAGDPVGHSFHFGKTRYHVVGVAREIHFPSVDARRDLPEFYTPFVLGGGVYMNIRCDGPCPAEAVVRRQVLATVPGAVVSAYALLNDVFREELARPRAAAVMGSTFAVIALLAAAGGLFSALTYAVGRRRLEFGIRIALGASPWRIRQLLFRDGIYLALAGVSLGIVMAVGLGKVIASLEYGVTGLDPLTWITAVGLLSATTLGAAWRPARQALRINPVTLLRDE